MSPLALCEADDGHEATHLVEHAMHTTHQWLIVQNLMPEGYPPVFQLPAFQWMMTQPMDPQMSPALRYPLAEALLHRGELERLRDLLSDDDDPEAEALRACALVQEGQWAAAQKLFEPALKALRQETGARKQLLPETILWMYPLCLLAQQPQVICYWPENSALRNPDHAISALVALQ